MIHQSGSGIPHITYQPASGNSDITSRPAVSTVNPHQLQSQAPPPVFIDNAEPVSLVANAACTTGNNTPISSVQSHISAPRSVTSTGIESPQFAISPRPKSVTQLRSQPTNSLDSSATNTPQMQPSIFRSSSPHNIPRSSTNEQTGHAPVTNATKDHIPVDRVSRSTTRSSGRRSSPASSSRARDQRSARIDQQQNTDSTRDKNRTSIPIPTSANKSN